MGLRHGPSSGTPFAIIRYATAVTIGCKKLFMRKTFQGDAAWLVAKHKPPLSSHGGLVQLLVQASYRLSSAFDVPFRRA